MWLWSDWSWYRTNVACAGYINSFKFQLNWFSSFLLRNIKFALKLRRTRTNFIRGFILFLNYTSLSVTKYDYLRKISRHVWACPEKQKTVMDKLDIDKLWCNQLCICQTFLCVYQQFLSICWTFPIISV